MGMRNGNGSLLWCTNMFKEVDRPAGRQDEFYKQTVSIWVRYDKHNTRSINIMNNLIHCMNVVFVKLKCLISRLYWLARSRHTWFYCCTPQEVLLAQFSLYVHKGGLDFINLFSYHLLLYKLRLSCVYTMSDATRRSATGRDAARFFLYTPQATFHLTRNGNIFVLINSTIN